nr:Arl6 [Gefionella okellyi]
MSFFKRLFERLGFSKREVKVLVVGLDNSGKSTILNHLKPKKNAQLEVVPTVGFQVEEFSKSNINFTAFDMSGQGRYRHLWEHYYKDCQGMIFVIDSSDKIRMCVVKDELETLLSHPDIRSKRVPILFFANKKDLPGSLSQVDCAMILELDQVTDHAYHIEASDAIKGDGLEEGINWLAEHIKS